MMERKMKEYAIYKGDEFQFIGTTRECADFLGVSMNTIRFYGSSSYQRRLDKRENLEGSTIVVNLGSWDE